MDGEEAVGRCFPQERLRIVRPMSADGLPLQVLDPHWKLHPLAVVPVRKSAGLDSSWKHLGEARIVEAEVLHCCDRL